MEKNVKKALSLFGITDDDIERLVFIQPTMSAHAGEMGELFYNHLLKIPETKRFLPTKKVVSERVVDWIDWFNDLFCGQYDDKYFHKIKKIGIAHVKIGLDSQYVNVGINYIRNFVMDVIDENYKDSEDLSEIKRSVSKILDFNLGILTKSYSEAELKKVFLSHRLESALVAVAERFTYGLNLVLVMALMGISVGVVYIFFMDIAHMLEGGDVNHGIVSALGSLIIIWVMIELMETEVEHLKGKAFPAIIFIHVVLVSFIREVLVVSLQHDIHHQMLMVGTALVLGIIYWLVANAEKNSSKKEED